MRPVTLVGTMLIVGAVLTGCVPTASAPTVTVTQSVAPTPTSTPKPTAAPTPTAHVSAFAASIRAEFPGYPLVVSVGSLDSRVASWLENNNLSEGRVVALVPGVYTPYNPNVPDLNIYLDNAHPDGDCVMRSQYFSDRGGSCWNGVLPGSEEPAAG